MSAPQNLTPQEPCVIVTDDQEPAMSAPVGMAQLAQGTVADILARLANLSDTELAELAVFERQGQARTTALAAIQDELSVRKPALTPTTVLKASDPIPKRFGQPILTEAGWVVPEAHQLPKG